MEYQKIANLIDEASNQPSKFRTKNWVEINDESRGTYNVNRQIKFKTTMLKSSLRDYSNAYIIVKGTITVNNTAADSFNLTDSFNFKVKITGQTGDDGTKNVEITVPLKYLSNFWRTLEMPLINCEVNLILTWSSTCVIVSTNNTNQNATFTITNTRLYVPVVTLSTQENAKLLQQLKSGFKRVINWNKYLSKKELLAQSPSLNHLVEPSFQGVNRFFVLPFENDAQRTSAKRYYLPTAEIKDYNALINGENFFDQPIKNDKITYDNIRKIATGQGDDYTTACLLNYQNIKDYYKMIPIDFSKQQALDADPRAIQKLISLQI